MSAFASLASALPLKADVAEVGPESPKLTQPGHSKINIAQIEEFNKQNGTDIKPGLTGLPFKND